MKNPQVLILSGDEFSCRLMVDLVRSNDLTAEAVARPSSEGWVDALAEGRVRPSVLVVDLDEPLLHGREKIERIQKLPRRCRPMILGLSRDPQASDDGALGLAGLVSTPLDTGEFARAVSRLALQDRLVAEA